MQLNYHNFIKNNNFYISQLDWKELNKNYDKQNIKNEIIKAIREYNILLPFNKPTIEDMYKDFEKLKNCSIDILKEGEWFSRYEYKWEKNKEYLDGNNTGLNASNFFHFNNRLLCDSINSPSPIRVWNNDKFLNTLLNYFWSGLIKDDITISTFRTAIVMRKYMASQFKPIIAKYIYNKYGNNGMVLDFSSGWGDRLLGFWTSNCFSYIGIDPNINLIEGYNSQISTYKTLISNKTAQILSSCSEDVNFKEEKFDLLFTSTPYFNIERYTQQDNQSFKKFKKLNNWLEGFLFKSINNFWNNLKDGGYLILNISDVYSNHTINKICDPMNDFISTLNKSNYKGCIGMKMIKRPNTFADKNGVFCEPLWIWCKN